MSINPSLFTSLGLSEQEASVYLAALELGEATVQELSRKSGVKRTSIYNFIDSLKERQILQETKRKRRSVFSAAHPHQLLELEKLKLHEFERAMPELLAINNRSLRKPRVTFYEDINGIKEVYNNMLKYKQPIICFSDQKHMWPTLGQEYCEYFPPERARRGIPLRMIATDTAENRKYAQQDKVLARETRFISGERDFRTEINVYGNSVILASFRSVPPFAVLIEDKDIAETLRVTWQELWERL